MTSAEPEVLILRRVAPFGLPAAALALLLGGVAGGWNVGWSAAIGVAVVWANAALSALIQARAARVSLTALFGAVMGGFVVRMGTIVALMAGLNQLSFFSPLVFGLAVVPATLALLGFEMKLLAGGVGQGIQTPPRPGGAASGKVVS
jgi:hypothetical protein